MQAIILLVLFKTEQMYAYDDIIVNGPHLARPEPLLLRQPAAALLGQPSRHPSAFLPTARFNAGDDPAKNMCRSHNICMLSQLLVPIAGVM